MLFNLIAIQTVGRKSSCFFVMAFLPFLIRAQVEPVRELTSDSSFRKAVIPVSAPLVLMAVGSYGAYNKGFLDGYHTPVKSWVGNSNLSRRADDVFSLLPIPSVYVFDALGIKARHDFANRSLVLLKAELMMLGTVHLAKQLTGIMRPDSSDRLSFPSGHTAQAFMAASFWHHEMGQHGRGFVIAGYAMATAVASMRVMHNKHWVSDVVAGAGTGILATEIAYRTHRFKKRKWGQWMLAPDFRKASQGLYFFCRF